MQNLITQTEVNGKPAYETEVRGIEYLAHQRFDGVWVVCSRRHRWSMTVKHFPTAEAVAASVKAFRNLDALVSCEAVA